MKLNLKKDMLTDTPNKVEWGLAISISVLIFCTMYYVDNKDIFKAAFQVNEQLFDWKSVSFLGTMIHPYGVIHQWICQLWVLPINLFHHMFGLEFDSSVTFLWCKLCIPFFLFFCVKETNCIAETLGIEKKNIKWMDYLMLTTVLVVLPVFHVAQTDCLYLLFMLKGVRSLVKKDVPCFLLWFAVANSLKMISLIVFVPLVLLQEKRIMYVLRNLVLGCIIIPVQRIWYRVVGMLNGMLFAPDSSMESVTSSIQTVESRAEAVGEFYNSRISTILYFEFPAVMKGYTASLLIFIFSIFCVWCYMQKENVKEWEEKCLYTSVVSLAIFFSMASTKSYWIVIFYPFLFLLIYKNHRRLRLNLILEKVFTLTIFLVCVTCSYWVFGGSQTFEDLFLTKWGIVPSGHALLGEPNIAGYLNKLGVEQMMPVIIGVCLASIIGLAWVNYPKLKYEENLTEEYTIQLQHGFALLNVFILYVWYFANVILLGRY